MKTSSFKNECDELWPIPDRPGWFRTNEGDEVFFPRYHEGTISDRQQLVDELLAVNATPLVSAISLAGVLPPAASLEAIEAELLRAPPHIVAAWRDRGGRVEVVPGKDASLHPQALPSQSRSGAWHWAKLGGLIVVAAAECDGHCVLHELGHAWDLGSRFSRLPAWQQICASEAWHADEVPGPGLFGGTHGDYYRSQPEEAYAESFARYVHDAETRAKLGPSIVAFIETTI